MAVEIEAKLKVESHEPVRERLREVGAKRLGAGLETNHIFDRADGSLRAAGSGLRVRAFRADGAATESATLTFKGKTAKGSLKSREEIEIDVSDAATAVLMLERLGFRRILRYQKRRESWTLGECRVELDQPPAIGLYVEIEGPGEAAIGAVQEELRLSHIEHTRASYPRMLMAHCQSAGITSFDLEL